MKRRRRHLLPLAAGLALGFTASLGSDSHAAEPCTEGQTMPCRLANGCGGLQTCLREEWQACACAGGIIGDGEPCESKCDEQSGAVACDSTCTEVIGCRTDTCQTPCEQTGVVVCLEGTYDQRCVAPEVCNGCDDDSDGEVDNMPGTQEPLREACNPNGCEVGGERVCEDTQWSKCSGCSGQGTCTVCNQQIGYSCDENDCDLAPCEAPEICNGCDDDQDGVLDNDLHCPKCSL